MALGNTERRLREISQNWCEEKFGLEEWAALIFTMSQHAGMLAQQEYCMYFTGISCRLATTCT
jgi:hypothetical protein